MHEDEARGLTRCGRRRQLGPVVGHHLVELGDGLGHVGGAERPGHHGGLGDVLVAAGRVQRLGAVAVVGAQEAVDLGHVHPAQQVRVGRGVRTPVGGGAGDAAVDGPHDADGAVGVLDRAERRLGQEGAGALQASPRVAAVAGVLVDGRHRQRVQRLQQQRPDAADEHRRVAVHGADGVVGAEPARTLGDTGCARRRRGPSSPAMREKITAPMRPRTASSRAHADHCHPGRESHQQRPSWRLRMTSRGSRRIRRTFVQACSMPVIRSQVSHSSDPRASRPCPCSW